MTRESVGHETLRKFSKYYYSEMRLMDRRAHFNTVMTAMASLEYRWNSEDIYREIRS